MINSLIFFFASFVACAALTPLIIAWSRRSGIGLDRPDDVRKKHSGAIPRLGGVAIAAVVLVASLIVVAARPDVRADWLPIIICSSMFFCLGLWDDLAGLSAKFKFFAQIGIALMAYALGLGIDKVSYPGGGWSVELEGWSLIITVIWLIAVPNIINLIDGFDGLAGGLGVFLAVTLGIVGLMAEQLPAAWLAFALAGALVGFLIFNFPPAKIFLGDGGAYLIGFCIAALSMESSQKGSVAAVLMVTVVALGLPILDTSFAMIRRTFRGFPMFHADDEHIHHRLEGLGFSKRRIIVGVYGVCVVLSLVGLSIFWSQGRTLPIAAGVVFLMAIFAVRYLKYFTGWEDMRRLLHMTGGRREQVRFALLQAKLLDLEVDRSESPDEFWPMFRHALERTGFLSEQDEGLNEIRLANNGEAPLIIFAPVDHQMPEHWHRIAKCFVPAYKKAYEKWKISPADLLSAS